MTKHIPEGMLRRLVDDPLAVPDDLIEHVDRCARCQAQKQRVASDAARAHQLLGRPQPVPDVDRAWASVGARLGLAAPTSDAVTGLDPAHLDPAGLEPTHLDPAGLEPTHLDPAGLEPTHLGSTRRATDLHRRSARRMRPRRFVGTTSAVVVAGTLVAGVAAAATLTVVFSPAQVAPLPVSPGDLQAVTSVLGLDGSFSSTRHSSASTTGGTSTATSGGASSTAGTGPSAIRSWAFGTIDMTVVPHPVQEPSLPAAESAAGTTIVLPPATDLPSGVQGPPSFVAEPGGRVTVTFDTAAGPPLAGSTLTLHIGPGIVALYHGAGTVGAGAVGTAGTTGPTGRDFPAMAVATMVRPTATSTGATTSELESFVLSQPGFPKDLAREIRLLGNLQTILPIPVPTGVTETTTQVGGAPAVLLSVGGQAVSAVVWEDGKGTIRTVGGLLDTTDTLDVARQLG